MNLFTQKSAVGRAATIVGIVVLCLATMGFLMNLGTIFEVLEYTNASSEASILLATLMDGTLTWYVSGLLLLGLGEVIRLLSVAAGEEGAGK